jgi:hypothetical protein
MSSSVSSFFQMMPNASGADLLGDQPSRESCFRAIKHKILAGILACGLMVEFLEFE